MRALLAFAAVAGLSGCAAHYPAGAAADPYGFWFGVWHGLVFPYALVANGLSWLVGLVGLAFMESIELVGRPNTGTGYYIGFAIGLCAFWGPATNRTLHASPRLG